MSIFSSLKHGNYSIEQCTYLSDDSTDPKPVLGIVGDIGSNNITKIGGQTLPIDDTAMVSSPVFLPIGGEYRAIRTTYSDGDATILQTNIFGYLKTEVSYVGNRLEITSDGNAPIDIQRIYGEVISAGTGTVTNGTQRITIANNDNQYGTVGDAAAVDGAIHAQLRSIAEAVETLDDMIATISSTDVGRVAIFDDNDTQITSFGSPSTIATHRSPYDFTATYTSNVTITLAGHPAITDSSQIVYIRQVNTTAHSSTVYVNGSGGVTFEYSANVITIQGAGTPFTANDVYEIGINYQDKAHDSTLDVNKQIEQSPLSSHRNRGDNMILDDAQLSSTTSYVVLPWDTYKNGSIQVLAKCATNASDSVTLKVYATNKHDIDITSPDPSGSYFGGTQDGWTDVSSDILGAANWQITGNATEGDDMWWLDTQMVCEYLLLEVAYVRTATGTAYCDIYYKKAF